MLNLVGDYGSSSDDDEDDQDDLREAPRDDDAGKRIASPPRDSFATSTTGAQKNHNDAHAPSTSQRVVSVLPSASALFESSVSGLGSGGSRPFPGASVGGQQRCES